MVGPSAEVVFHRGGHHCKAAAREGAVDAIHLPAGCVDVESARERGEAGSFIVRIKREQQNPIRAKAAVVWPLVGAQQQDIYLAFRLDKAANRLWDGKIRFCGRWREIFEFGRDKV